MNYLFIILFVLCPLGHAKSGLYAQLLGSGVYSTSELTSLSSSTGSGIGISGGIRMNTIGIELTAKRFSLNNQAMGDDNYSSTIKDSTFSGGIRLFIDNSFSFKLGAIFHNLEMDVHKNSVRRADEESDGDFYGIYAGMGINHQISSDIDFYLESNLYPIPQAKISLIDFEFGLRMYIGN
jgi:hypothetical protein